MKRITLYNYCNLKIEQITKKYRQFIFYKKIKNMQFFLNELK